MSVATCGGGMGEDGGEGCDEKKMRVGLAQVLDFVDSNDEDEDAGLVVVVPKLKISLSSILQALSQPNPNPNPIKRRGISRKSKSCGNLKEMGGGVKEMNENEPLMKTCRVVTVHEISHLHHPTPTRSRSQ